MNCGNSSVLCGEFVINKKAIVFKKNNGLLASAYEMDISITTTIIALHSIDVWEKKIVAEFCYYDKKMTNCLVGSAVIIRHHKPYND